MTGKSLISRMFSIFTWIWKAVYNTVSVRTNYKEGNCYEHVGFIQSTIFFTNSYAGTCFTADELIWINDPYCSNDISCLSKEVKKCQSFIEYAFVYGFKWKQDFDQNLMWRISLFAKNAINDCFCNKYISVLLNDSF